MKPRKPNPTTLNVYFVKSVWTQMKSPSTSLVYLYLRNKTSLKQKEKENELSKEFQIKSKYGADTSFLKRLNWCLSGAITNAINGSLMTRSNQEHGRTQTYKQAFPQMQIQGN